MFALILLTICGSLRNVPREVQVDCIEYNRYEYQTLSPVHGLVITKEAQVIFWRKGKIVEYAYADRNEFVGPTRVGKFYRYRVKPMWSDTEVTVRSEKYIMTNTDYDIEAIDPDRNDREGLVPR